MPLLVQGLYGEMRTEYYKLERRAEGGVETIHMEYIESDMGTISQFLQTFIERRSIILLSSVLMIWFWRF